MAKRIGGDWVENVDPASGRKYYANLKTKVTSWEYPAELTAAEAVASAAAAAAPAGNDLENWAERDDPKSGRKYYFHKVTKVTQWQKPDGWDAHVAKQATSAATPTPAAAPSPAPAAAAAAASGSPDDENDPTKWRSVVDPTSQREYYFNTATKKTQWKKPACVEQAEAAAAAATPAPTPSAAAAAPVPTAASTPAKPEPAAEPVAQLSAAMASTSISSTPEPARSLTPPTSARTAENDDTPAESKNSYEDEHRMLELLDYPTDETTEELVRQVEGITLEQYAEKYFNFDRKGMFGKRTTMEKILRWKQDVIRTSLRQLNADMAAEAVQAFRNVTGFMGDRNTGKADMDHAAKLLTNMMLAPEELRDEIFCQIAKQVNANPSSYSTERGWQLMLIALAAFPPSNDLMKHLMGYCAANLSSNQGTVGRFADIAMHRIPKICKYGPRREIPTRMEMEGLREGNPLTVRVWFLDGKYTMLKVDPWTTAKEFEHHIAVKLGLRTEKPFALYEVSSSEEERVLDADERVLDLVAYWCRIELEEKHKKGKTAEIEEFRFVYKVRYFFDVPDTDHSAIELMYIQAVHDVVDARYPCTEQDACTLAALQVQEEFGDHPGDLKPCTYIHGALNNYVPRRYTDGRDHDELEQTILRLYQKLSGYSQLEARLSYLDYIKSWKIYGSTYFFAEPQNNREFPAEVVLAINHKGILVVDPATKDFLAEYDYQNVVTWGHSAASFVVVTGNLTRQTKVYFKTDQGKEMNTMVRTYVEAILA